VLLVSLTFCLLSFSSFRDDDVVVASFFFLERELIVSAVDVLGCLRDFEPALVEFLFLAVLVDEYSFVEDEEDDRFLLLDRELPFADDEDEVDPDAADAAAEIDVAATDIDRTKFTLLAARVTTIIQLQQELVA